MPTIKNVTVLGAGVLGAQIAFQTAYKGFDVVSWDINDEAIAAAKGRFDSFQERYLQDVEGSSERSIAAARERLTQTSDLEAAVRDSDLVIEAVPERIDIKNDVWSRVGASAKEGAIFVSNSSTMLPSKLAPASGREEDFLNLHFANNIWVLNIAEIMPHAGTRPELVDTLTEFAEQIGMVPVVLKKEKPGYILNSLLIPLLRAAQELWAEGYATIENIDADWRVSTGAPMGPFEFMDMIGLRTIYAIGTNSVESGTAPEWQARFLQTIKEEYLDKGRFGWESGKGFYDLAGPKRA
ncbi:3-hydroxyacyl-CoA dehydrogenase [Corynebacterium qintianiae]|uniref:3-hydroxyacyl-CoA dehydrogenase n=1 Tax=Corynebacterium qintianiae TaxID=2709392 RepID=A0A7T0PDT2_9CORY|nr:3-hydroxyacyl-CoA dehydrogenase [Corynebacterium qintianiae]QPK83233.1 3-hydroxyacyl-CoA dehydrogenase [Corynebacterium qintianiae]